MSETLETLKQPTSMASRNAISLPVSVDGAMPCGLRVGQMTDPCGREAHPANLSVSREIAGGKLMNGTLPLSGSTLSEQPNLSGYLASKLRQRLEPAGSMIYKMNWKQKATPRGRLYYQLAASAHRTNVIDCGSWPTPQVSNADRGGYADMDKLKAMWKKGRQKNLQDVVKMAAWATPNTMDHLALRSWDALLRQATTTRKGRKFPANLREQVDPVSQEIYTTGKIPSLSNALTEKTASYQLNPRFSLWLMGYPIEWASCAARVTLLSRKSRRR